MNLPLRAFATLLFLVVGLEKSNSYAVAVGSLTGLVISTGALSPVFASITKLYTCSVAYPVSEVTVTTSSSSSIRVKVNSGIYVTVTSGTASSPLTLNLGTNTIFVQPGLASAYSITVTRASPVVNKNGQATTGSDYLNNNGKTGGLSFINSNGQLTPKVP